MENEVRGYRDISVVEHSAYLNVINLESGKGRAGGQEEEEQEEDKQGGEVKGKNILKYQNIEIRAEQRGSLNLLQVT